MRGEHATASSMYGTSLGSSPHARGARGLAEEVKHGVGIIPACAGSTIPPQIALRVSWIIPACAGSTTPRPRPCTRTWDHPRMRGEHPSKMKTSTTIQGSSPHARGAPSVGVLLGRPRGIIPACAGSTSDAPFDGAGERDHPRMRGEHRVLAANDLNGAGSSPHARGAPSTRICNFEVMGIIPACAGSTRGLRGWRCRRRDHPRMRGEHLMFHRPKNLVQGSSPHARGAHHVIDIRLPGAGIIPACAGSTAYTISAVATSQDHPRMRGEHAV